MDDELGVGILRRGALVDDDEVFAFEVVDEAGGWIHGQRGAGDDEAVCLLDLAQGAFENILVEGFFVEDDVGLDDAAVFGAAGNAGGVFDEVKVVEAAAGHAVVAHDGAVELVDVFAAGELVQAVDVLGDDGGEFSLALHLGELQMHGAGAVVWRDHFGAVEFEKFLGVAVEKAAAEHGLRIVFESFLMVEAVFAAKIGDAAFGGNAGAAEEDDAV